MRSMLMVAVIVMALACSCASAPKKPGGKKMRIEVTSSAFTEGGMIPKKYTCDGQDVSPPLAWNHVSAAKSIALICDDPDAPGKTWVHWVLYDLPGDTHQLRENMPHDRTLPNGAKQGITDFKKIGYGGPCPPSGTHRYYFKVYALDKKLDLAPGATKAQLLGTMKGHVMGEGALMGRYSK